jgi:DtxR family Mn-dependent transcriptional regulator
MTAEPPVHTSESEEMYLITVARAVEDGADGPVPIPQLAEALGVSQVAANEMVKKLDARGLLDYVPYRGATLTESGHTVAQGVLRRRRLWGVFLNEHLGLTADEADAVACEFEHVTPDEVESRLAAFLGDPSFGPQGRPIPAGIGASADRPVGASLATLGVGMAASVDHVSGDASVRSFLAAEGVVPGVAIRIDGRGDDGTVLATVGEHFLELTEPVAAAVFVVGYSP